MGVPLSNMGILKEEGRSIIHHDTCASITDEIRANNEEEQRSWRSMIAETNSISRHIRASTLVGRRSCGYSAVDHCSDEKKINGRLGLAMKSIRRGGGAEEGEAREQAQCL
ncbi:hypothetical protein PIB30_001175 [Stylosanthes scabra]|uniref:Uncharacterized protein n=1 Tax=Stylosanthes scabra TaxID=79078 RepID=A0ABU6V4L8_9FABA|nr:hypothetical protein [Stylosanthes scabra]